MKLLPSCAACESSSSRRTRVGGVRGCTPGVVQVVDSLRGVFRSNDYYEYIAGDILRWGGWRVWPQEESFAESSISLRDEIRHLHLMIGRESGTWRFAKFRLLTLEWLNTEVDVDGDWSGEEKRKEGFEARYNKCPAYLLITPTTLLHRAAFAARVPSVTERAMIYRRVTCVRATPQEYVYADSDCFIDLCFVKLNENHFSPGLQTRFNLRRLFFATGREQDVYGIARILSLITLVLWIKKSNNSVTRWIILLAREKLIQFFLANGKAKNSEFVSSANWFFNKRSRT